jgi:alkaline phosphatase
MKKIAKKTTFLFIFLLFSINFLFSQVKYVFYFIGDGMGMNHVNLTQAYLSANENIVGAKELTMTSFPYFGMATTFSATRYITCSAAAGTALATGTKTSIGTIGLSVNHKDTLFSIAYYAKQEGFKIGILSSVGMNHSTPAAFFAHQPKRSEYYDIAMQIPNSNFDVFGGGGLIVDKKKTGNPFDLIKKSGYLITNTKKDFEKLKPSNKKVFMISPFLGDEADIPYAIDQNENCITLADFTSKAIELLFNDKGFFMMVEGGKIDWAAHSNDGATVIQEVIDFDNAIKVALEFYKKYPEQTLIVITADHETGGLSIGNETNQYETYLSVIKNQKKSITFLSDTIDKFITLNNLKSFTFDKMMSICQTFITISDFTETELKQLQTSYDLFITKKEDNHNVLYNDNNPIANTWISIINKRAGIGWTTHAHTGSPVPVFAIGVGAEKFSGFYDNTDIPKKISEIMKLQKK